MATEGEEWADGADTFFAEFASSATGEKSKRRKGFDTSSAARQQDTILQARAQQDRAESADQARRRIAAAVVNRASAKEIQQAMRVARKAKGVAKSDTEGSSSPVSDGHASIANHRGEAEKRHSKQLSKTHRRLEAKSGRKAAKKEEEKVNAIKYRRVLRKQRR